MVRLACLLFFLLPLLPPQFLAQNSSTCWRETNKKTKTTEEFNSQSYNEKSEFFLLEKEINFYVVKKNKNTIFSDFILVDF